MTTANVTGTKTSQPEESKRRTERILLRIPITVQGIRQDGKRFKENTHTLAINRHGARIALRSEVQPEARVTIINLQNNISCPFRLVGPIGKPLDRGPEWGVECLQPEANFWGIFFPDKVPRHAKREVIDALLECSICHSRELAQLGLEQYQTITTHPSLSRGCLECGAITEWKFGSVEGDRGGVENGAAVSTTSVPARSVERRRSKRVAIKVPVRIRLEEIGQTENLSKTGVCFSSNLIMRVGDRVRLTVGYAPGGNEKEVPAQVVWRQHLEDSTRPLYGVQLEETE